MAARLTLKQETFVEAYIRLQNGYKAYKEVYDKEGKLTDNSAYSAASRMLRKVKILEAIKTRKEEIRALNSVCAIEELAEGWSDEIRFDLGELVDEHGIFKSPKDLSPKIRRLIQGIKIKESIVEEEGGSRTVLNRWIEYKLPDRQRARIELGKRIGFYPAEKVEHSGLVVTNLELTEDDRGLLRRAIDGSIRKLMEAGREKSS
jgi:hypothetical protein